MIERYNMNGEAKPIIERILEQIKYISKENINKKIC